MLNAALIMWSGSDAARRELASGSDCPAAGFDRLSEEADR